MVAMPENEQGFDSRRYQVIPRTLIFIFDGEKVLLLKGRADKKIWPGMYNGLGGHIEEGEDVLSAAYRELREESGIAHSQLILCGLVTIELKNGNGILLFVFKGKFEGDKLLESSEGTLEWIEMARLRGMNLVDDLPTILPLVHMHVPEEQPFYARYFYDEAGRLNIKLSDMKKTNLN